MGNIVRRTQVHRAYIEQTDFYILTDGELEHLNGLPEEEREEFVTGCAYYQDGDTEVLDLLETVEVEVSPEG